MEPILFLQFHSDPSDVRAGRYIAPQHAGTIRYRDVQTAGEALSEIRAWLTGNDNAYAVFIGTHGDPFGLGPSVNNGIEWDELLEALQGADAGYSLWLGACESSCIVEAWSPLEGDKRYPDWILGFPNKVDASDIMPVLSRLMRNSDVNEITYVDEELGAIREAAFGTSASMFYLVDLEQGGRRYVNVDDFPSEMGATFQDYLAGRAGPIGEMLSEAIDQLKKADKK